MVTGACGFLGTRLVRLLLEEEKMAEIRLMDKHIEPKVLHSLEGKQNLRIREKKYCSLCYIGVIIKPYIN